jgi:hypothetical protein
MVVASAVNTEGEQVYPRKWNHNFIGMPILKREEQHRPTVTEAELGEILATAKQAMGAFSSRCWRGPVCGLVRHWD